MIPTAMAPSRIDAAHSRKRTYGNDCPMLLSPSAEPMEVAEIPYARRMYMFVRAMMNGATPTMRENATR